MSVCFKNLSNFFITLPFGSTMNGSKGFINQPFSFFIYTFLIVFFCATLVLSIIHLLVAKELRPVKMLNMINCVNFQLRAWDCHTSVLSLMHWVPTSVMEPILPLLDQLLDPRIQLYNRVVSAPSP